MLLVVMTLAAVGISAAVKARQQSGWQILDDRMNVAFRRGSHDDLQRARLLAMRLAVAAAQDGAPEAALGMIDARLAVDFGHDLIAEGRGALDRAAQKQSNPAAQALADAARALLLMGDGQLDGALSLANAAIEGAPSTPHGYWISARIKLRQGDAAAAARILEAAAVLAPDFLEIRVAWAEALFDLADSATAKTAVAKILAQAPDLERAQLLGAAPVVCTAPRAPEISAPEIRASCAYRRARRAWIDGDSTQATMLAVEAAKSPGHDPRRLADLAHVLAQLGLIDHASDLLDKAQSLSSPHFGGIGWARVAIALGRGTSAVAAKEAALSPEARVTAARLSLATAGLTGLDAALADMGPALPVVLQNLRTPAPAPGIADPLRNYVDGLRARLAGDLPTAIRLFSLALDGHGESCHAAGELLAALQTQDQPLLQGLLDPISAVNRDCIHLHRSENVVVPAAKKNRARGPLILQRMR